MRAAAYVFYALLAAYDRATLRGLQRQRRLTDPYYKEIFVSELLNAAKAAEARRRIDWRDAVALVCVLAVMAVLAEWAIRIALD